MRAYRATVGATDGNIIAAIITTQMPRNQPSAPRSVQGPRFMPCIWCAVHHHPNPAMAKSVPTRPRRTRTAAIADARPPPPGWDPCASVLIASGGPGELRGGQTRLALVDDAERVDPRTPC